MGPGSRCLAHPCLQTHHGLWQTGPVLPAVPGGPGQGGVAVSRSCCVYCGGFRQWNVFCAHSLSQDLNCLVVCCVLWEYGGD